MAVKQVQTIEETSSPDSDPGTTEKNYREVGVDKNPFQIACLSIYTLSWHPAESEAENGFIRDEEYKKIDALNRETFSPVLSKVYG